MPFLEKLYGEPTKSYQFDNGSASRHIKEWEMHPIQFLEESQSLGFI